MERETEGGWGQSAEGKSNLTAVFERSRLQVRWFYQRYLQWQCTPLRCDRYSILFFIALVLCVHFPFVPGKFLANFKFLVIIERHSTQPVQRQPIDSSFRLVQETKTRLSLGHLRGFYSFSIMPLGLPCRITYNSAILHQRLTDFSTAVSTKPVPSLFWLTFGQFVQCRASRLFHFASQGIYFYTPLLSHSNPSIMVFRKI